MNCVNIPESVKVIPPFCLIGNWTVRFGKITIPLSEKRVIYGDKIFNNQPHFNQSFYLPGHIYSNSFIINETEYESLQSLTIPSFVTSLDEMCFYQCFKLEKIVLP